jgi:hypothetical protein
MAMLGNIFHTTKRDHVVPLLFIENETNNERLFGSANANPYVKDGINNYIINEQYKAVNPMQIGTKVAPHYLLTVEAGETQVVQLRLTKATPAQIGDPMDDFEAILATRLQEANEFYDSIKPALPKSVELVQGLMQRSQCSAGGRLRAEVSFVVATGVGRGEMICRFYL